ncbi:MAG: kinase/pyrophosphorylase, partial [Ignavibacteria bacterium]|nr:kinase/pyrophosphorylase [Ignavibacteria bacterium]
MTSEKRIYNIFIVSDGSGRTAEQALSAALIQFSEVEVKIFKRAKVRTEQKVKQAVEEAKKAGGFIVHT